MDRRLTVMQPVIGVLSTNSSPKYVIKIEGTFRLNFKVINGRIRPSASDTIRTSIEKTCPFAPIFDVFRPN